MKKPNEKNKQKEITLEQEIEKADKAVIILEIHGKPELRPLKNVKYIHEVLGLLEAMKVHYMERHITGTLNLLSKTVMSLMQQISLIKKHLGIKDDKPPKLPIPPKIEDKKDEKEKNEKAPSEGKTEKKEKSVEKEAESSSEAKKEETEKPKN